MSAIDTQNEKSIRDTMQIVVKVGESSNPYFEFDNSNLLSCELQLRSDLQPIDPTLPESEIVIRAYWPEDISEELITIADDTIITYQAGYTGDMSPVRTFYLSEQIQWEANVLTVHGVDAVHFLDVSAPPRFIGNFYDEDPPGSIGLRGERWGSNTTAPFNFIITVFKDLITRAGVTIVSESSYTNASSSTEASYIAGFIPRQSYRDSVANLMNLCHLEFASSTFSLSKYFWLTYVDAGRPTITYNHPSSKWTINEVDCGDIKRHVDKNIIEIDAKIKRLDISPYRVYDGHPSVSIYQGNQQVGTAEIFKNKGAGLSLNNVTTIMDYVANRDTVPEGVVYNKHFLKQFAHPNKRILPIYIWYGSSYRCGTILRDSQTDTWQDYNDSTTGTTQYSPKLSDFWSALDTYEYIEEDDKDTFSIQIFGSAYNTTDESKTYSGTGSGIVANPSKTMWGGSISAKAYNNSSNVVNILPDAGFNSLLNRSQETGSFTWKGDPRMQPRDVFTFTYLDGTTELRTVETINLKHEGGGTVATITYRKGIV